jgi:hypothetical protein
MTPTNQKLYDTIKIKIYKKYPKHSAYRSGLLVKAYKKAFKGPGQPYKGKKPKVTGLTRWFKEDWKSDTGHYGYTSKYSVYRPTKRVTKKTPKTFSELSKKDILKAKREKYKTGRVKKF